MRDTDKHAFQDALTPWLQSHDRPVDPPTLRFWWEALQQYDIEQVQHAILEAARDSAFKPTPANVIAKIPLRPGDYLPSELAWNAVPKDEGDAAYVCMEMLGAWTSCRDDYDAGDRIGARRTFLEAYDKLIVAAKASGKRASWFLSASTTDKTATAAAIDEAESMGLIGHDVAAEKRQQHQPAIEGPREGSGLMHVLEHLETTQAGKSLGREWLTDIRANLKRIAEGPPRPLSEINRDRHVLGLRAWDENDYDRWRQTQR